MSRFILRYGGKNPKPAADVRQILALRGLTLIDDSTPRMLLVDAPEDKLKILLDSLQGWVMSPEQIVQLPDPRPKLKNA